MGYNGPAPEGPKPAGSPSPPPPQCRGKTPRPAEAPKVEPQRSGFLTGLLFGWLFGSGD